jgi:hypothetical protein
LNNAKWNCEVRVQYRLSINQASLAIKIQVFDKLKWTQLKSSNIDFSYIPFFLFTTSFSALHSIAYVLYVFPTVNWEQFFCDFWFAWYWKKEQKKKFTKEHRQRNRKFAKKRRKRKEKNIFHISLFFLRFGTPSINSLCDNSVHTFFSGIFFFYRRFVLFSCATLW